MRAGAVVGLALLAVLASDSQGAKDRYSEACPEAAETKLADDEYRGEYEARVTAVAPQLARIEVRVHGTFVMDREGGAIKHVTGKEYYSLHTFTTHFLRPSATMEAEADLDWGGPTTEQRFDLGGELKGGGSVGTTDASLNLGSGTLRDVVSFTLTSASCDYAEGTVRSVALETARQRLAALPGYEVSTVASYWHAATEKKSGEAQRQLRRDLDQIWTGAPSRSREALTTSSGQIASQIVQKHEHFPLMTCLLDQYRTYVAAKISAWVDDDIKALADQRKALAANMKAPGSTYLPGGNYQLDKLEQLAKKALESDRALALAGVDTCYAELHAKLWTELDASLNNLLTYLLAKKAPPQDLLRVLRDAELLGEISPPLRERVYAALAKSARETYDALRKDVEALRQRDGCAPNVQEAVRGLHAVAKQCNLVGGGCVFPIASDQAWQRGCAGHGRRI